MKFTDEQLKAARMGEFQELAWNFQIQFKANLQVSQKQYLLDSLTEFTEFTESKKLGLGGEPDNFYLVSLLNRKAVTPQERKSLTDWLIVRPEINKLLIPETGLGDGLADAWFIMMLIPEGGITTPAFDEFFS